MLLFEASSTVTHVEKFPSPNFLECRAEFLQNIALYSKWRSIPLVGRFHDPAIYAPSGAGGEPGKEFQLIQRRNASPPYRA